ncbi:MAG TPA: hypothetical protein VL285_01970 [Bryobacteraceae bacterium]|jgi:hypothetical protein|nr:hypothetical protein [Bryobacteraceae bacterium]
MDLPHPFGLRFRYIALAMAMGGVLAVYLIYWISRLVQAVTMAGVPNCPSCGLMHASQPADKSRSDWLFAYFHCAPHKCSVCRFRYYRPASAAMRETAASTLAPIESKDPA